MHRKLQAPSWRVHPCGLASGFERSGRDDQRTQPDTLNITNDVYCLECIGVLGTTMATTRESTADLADPVDLADLEDLMDLVDLSTLTGL